MRRLRRFALQFAGIFLVAVLLYPAILPLYGWGVRGLTNVALRVLPAPLSVESSAEGDWDVVRPRRRGGTRTLFTITASTLKLIWVSVVFLPSLILATPVAWRTRLRWLGVGLLLLVGIQVATHALFVTAWFEFSRGNLSAGPFQFLTVVHSTSGQLFPFALWGLLSWREWLPRTEGSLTSRGTVPRSP